MPIISDDVIVIPVKQRVETLLFTTPLKATHSIVNVSGIVNGDLGVDPTLNYRLYIKKSGSTLKRYLNKQTDFNELSPSKMDERIILGVGESLYVFMESSLETRVMDFLVSSLSENNPVVLKAGSNGFVSIKNSSGPNEVYRNDSPLGIYEVGNLYINNLSNNPFNYEVWITDNENVKIDTDEEDVEKAYSGTIDPQGISTIEGLLLPPLFRIYIRTLTKTTNSYTGTVCFNSLVVGD